jgi:HlyD family secretion protein
MRIANLNEMEVSVDVSENDIVRVHLNDTALIDIDAYRDEQFKGVVTEIANSANVTGVQTTDQVTNFTVKIRILRESYRHLIPKGDSAASPFRPGMSATVDIQTRRAGQVVSVPIQAVTTRDTTVRASRKEVRRPGDEEGAVEKTKEEEADVTECVFLIRDGRVQRQVVKTGIQDNVHIEITEGLKEGDEVVTGPFNAI